MNWPLSISLALFLTSCASRPNHATCLRLGSERVTLHGTLSLEERYGPPNYGESPETDQRMSVPIVELGRPIDVCSDDQSAANNTVSSIQIVSISPGHVFREGAGSWPGSLARAESGHHFTPIILVTN